jgi:site-specific recombinase XerD
MVQSGECNFCGTLVYFQLRVASTFTAQLLLSYLFRHTLATEMLGRGASLKEIGEVLRHRKADTTRIYAKVDFHALRNLAQPWPGGAR